MVDTEIGGFPLYPAWANNMAYSTVIECFMQGTWVDIVCALLLYISITRHHHIMCCDIIIIDLE
jgi:hypothetical protein